jgi:hypothetical protein
MNWLEAQLKSWAPRRPSARIERRLFPQRMRAADLTRSLAWLAPAAACMILALATVRQEGVSTGAARPEYMFAMIMSNQASASILRDDGAEPENRVMHASFEWTNRGGSGSSTRFMPSTNSSY